MAAYVQNNWDGTFSYVDDSGQETKFNDQGDAENYYNQQTGGAPPVPSGGSVGGVSDAYAGTTGGPVTRRPDGRYDTVNGPKTEAEMDAELRRAGWPGPGAGSAAGGRTPPTTTTGGIPADAYYQGGYMWEKLIADQEQAQARLDFDKAYQEQIQFPTMENQNKLRDAQARLTDAQAAATKANTALEQEKYKTGTKFDIWKQQGLLAQQGAQQTGFYTPPPPLTNVEADFQPQGPGGYAGPPPTTPANPGSDVDIRKMYDWGKRKGQEFARNPVPGRPSVTREEWGQAWGDKGLQFYDMSKSAGIHPGASDYGVERFLKEAQSEPWYQSSSSARPETPGTSSASEGRIALPGDGEVRSTVMPYQPMPGDEERRRAMLGVTGGGRAGLGRERPGGPPDGQYGDIRFAVQPGDGEQKSFLGGPTSTRPAVGFNPTYALPTPKGAYVTPEMFSKWAAATGYTPTGYETAEERQRLFERGITEAGITGTYGGRDTLAGLAEKRAKLMDEANRARMLGDSARADKLQVLAQQTQDQANALATSAQSGYMPGTPGVGGAPGTPGGATLERTRIEAAIEDAKKKTALAESQGNENLARQERERLDRLEGQRADLAAREREFNVGQSGYMAGYGPSGGGGGTAGVPYGGQTLSGRAQTQAEQAQQARLTGYVPSSTGGEGGQGSQLTAEQRNFYLQQYGYDPGAQGPSGATQYGGQTLAGRGQTEAEKAAERKWQYDQAMMKANPANYALVAAMAGEAPWQSAFTQPGQTRLTQKPPQQQPPLAGSGIGSVPSARNLSLQTYERMKPSEQESFGSALKAGGTTARDFEEEMKKYRPAVRQGGGASTWR